MFFPDSRLLHTSTRVDKRSKGPISANPNQQHSHFWHGDASHFPWDRPSRLKITDAGRVSARLNITTLQRSQNGREKVGCDGKSRMPENPAVVKKKSPFSSGFSLQVMFSTSPIWHPLDSPDLILLECAKVMVNPDFWSQLTITMVWRKHPGGKFVNWALPSGKHRKNYVSHYQRVPHDDGFFLRHRRSFSGVFPDDLATSWLRWPKICWWPWEQMLQARGLLDVAYMGVSWNGCILKWLVYNGHSN